MIIDTTQTKIEQDIQLKLDIANIQQQLAATANPDIRFGCWCGKLVCHGHKISEVEGSQYICRI